MLMIIATPQTTAATAIGMPALPSRKYRLSSVHWPLMRRVANAPATIT